MGDFFVKTPPLQATSGDGGPRWRRDRWRHEGLCGGDERWEIGVALGDPLELGDADHDVQAREGHIHLVGHERAELGEAEIVAIGFVEDLLRGIEGVHDEPGVGRLEAHLLEAGKAELRARDMIARRVERRRLQHRAAHARSRTDIETKSTPIDFRRTARGRT